MKGLFMHFQGKLREKKKRLCNAAVMFLFTLAIIFSVISLRFQRATIRLEDIDVNETVLALHYENWAWGYQNYLLIADKEGRCKFLELEEGEMQDMNLLSYDLEKGEIQNENLLSYMDACLKDDSIPYLDIPLDIKKTLLETVISMKDFDLKYIGEMCDAGSFCYYSVYGCGENREMVCMQEDGDFIWHSRFFEVTGICEKIHELYSSVFENELYFP